MKYLAIILTLVIAACSNSNGTNKNISALNGAWVSGCLVVHRDGAPSDDYVINTYNFNNGNYRSNFTLYSDKNCVNKNSKAQEEMGLVTFVEDVLTESGVTANKVQFERFGSDSIKPPTSETLLYIDNNILYFGAFLDDLNVIFFNHPYMKSAI